MSDQGWSKGVALQATESGSLQQLLVYGLSVVGTMGAGFVLVLLLVRLLPAEIYGGIVLTKVSLLVVVSLAGLGLSQAAVRWVGLKETPEVVLGTALVGVALSAVPASIILIGLMSVFGEAVMPKLDAPLFAAVLALVPSYMVNNELSNWPRALHQARRHAYLNTARAVQQLLFVTGGVTWIGNPAGFIYGLAIGEVLFMLWQGTRHLGRLKFRADLLRAMLYYGWPHTFVIATSFLLTYVDRYMLAFLTGDTSIVAHYDAAYALVSSALALLVRPFNLFLFPAYMRRFSEEGAGPTVSMIGKAQHWFLSAGLVLATVVVLLRQPLLNLLYPAGYTEAASVFAPIAYASVLNGAFMATVAGLYISQNTVMVGVCALTGLLANVVANYLLIPTFGIAGAAFSTAVSAVMQLVVGYFFARNILPVKFPLTVLAAGAFWLGLIDWLSR